MPAADDGDRPTGRGVHGQDGLGVVGASAAIE
jgi:hypothetical protein